MNKLKNKPEPKINTSQSDKFQNTIAKSIKYRGEIRYH